MFGKVVVDVCFREVSGGGWDLAGKIPWPFVGFKVADVSGRSWDPTM